MNTIKKRLPKSVIIGLAAIILPFGAQANS